MLRTLIAFLLLLPFAASAQSATSYDKAFADSLGADEYGMKRYQLVLLKTGTAPAPPKAVSDSLFAGHMANIGRLAAGGQLVVAGPLQKNDKAYRGIFILNVKTQEEARALLATDPAVKAGLLDAEIFGWYGSAALPTYLPNHARVEKKGH